jgi:hypothetical protein
MAAFKPDLVILLGTAPTGRGPEVSFVGPSSARGFAYDFSAAARGADARWRVSPDQRFITAGSVESLVGRDMGRPVLAIEFWRGSEAATNAKAVQAGILALTGVGNAVADAPVAPPDTPPPKTPVLGGH